jgi:chromosome segregation ATPase
MRRPRAAASREGGKTCLLPPFRPLVPGWNTSRVGDTRTQSLLVHAQQLDAEDADVSRRLSVVVELTERVGAVRAGAAEVAARLAGVPAEAASIDDAEASAREAAATARVELDDAENRLAALRASRRRREEEIARAERTTLDAQEALADAEARLARLATRRLELEELERALESERAALASAAIELAERLARIPRLSESGKLEPGTTLEEIDEWGSRSRAALFVVRGTLEAERDRIVVEAEALGTAALGEDLHGSSVALVRRRLEQALS